jgi:transaldolase
VTKLQQLHKEFGQSPWLDNLRRGYITSGQLKRLVSDGIRGLTSNPTIFQKAIEGSADYDEQFRSLVGQDTTVEEAYWYMVVTDISAALDLLLPVYDRSDGVDGYVSIELAPGLALDTDASVAAARTLHERIEQPNLLVKIPGTEPGLGAIRQMTSEGRSINVTLIFGLERYAQVIEAYLAGLEAHRGDLKSVASVASFFVSRVDTEVDRRLETIGTAHALELRGKAAIAQARCAYALFRDRFSGPRWDALAARGARVQRPLWASTSTKNPTYPDTMYVDQLIGPDTINTLPDATIAAFEDHGKLARTIDADIDGARRVLDALAEVGIDMEDVARVLEEEGVAAFAKSYDELLGSLEAKSHDVVR